MSCSRAIDDTAVKKSVINNSRRYRLVYIYSWYAVFKFRASRAAVVVVPVVVPVVVVVVVFVFVVVVAVVVVVATLTRIIKSVVTGQDPS